MFVTDALRDALAQVKELSRQIPELHAIKVQLETERDALKIEVSDLQDALRDALARLDAANNNLTQLRAELERRLHEKDEELDGIRSVSPSHSHSHAQRLYHGVDPGGVGKGGKGDMSPLPEIRMLKKYGFLVSTLLQWLLAIN